MDNQLTDVITYLQNIQSDIIGIIIPAIITATVALISLFINSLISIVQEKQKYNHEQFKHMQKAFPSLKNHLQQMRFTIALAKKCPHSFDSKLSKALQNYLAFKLDEPSYRSTHESEMQEIDKFAETIKEYVAEVKALQQFFKSETIPAMPLLHPCLRADIQEMLKSLQYWSYLLPKVEEPLINGAFFAEELNRCNLDDETLQQYIKLLDKWYQAY